MQQERRYTSTLDRSSAELHAGWLRGPSHVEPYHGRTLSGDAQTSSSHVTSRYACSAAYGRALLVGATGRTCHEGRPRNGAHPTGRSD